MGNMGGFQSKTFLKSKKVIALIIVSMLVLVVIAIILRTPQRSVAAFCSEINKQNNILTTSGRKYNLGPVYSSSDDMHAFAQAYGKLDQVAPSDIEPQVRTLKQTAEKIDSDPTQSLTAGLSGLSASTDVQNWVAAHCKSN